ncbi:hypothetical protein KY084_01155 [Stakelama sp. CBK3Z-3]|uniref:Uncharacterized protein n=1 Tax=Stakelama flava TaxID=2860338 RepID=A0ABS6XH04_9SPHN|nr:hypothetical protein [Stakelama flava]MBW4329486.1 hypothetical protein [Stakelama flava]
MTNDPNLYLIMAATALTGLAMMIAATLIGWKSWLALKKQELSLVRGRDVDAPPSSTGARIEIADLKERIRKLEAIAAGVDL